MREGAAILVADTAALAAAGAPDGADGRAGEDVPLFGCPELAREGAGGTPTLPLFLDRADLQDALAMVRNRATFKHRRSQRIRAHGLVKRLETVDRTNMCRQG